MKPITNENRLDFILEQTERYLSQLLEDGEAVDNIHLWKLLALLRKERNFRGPRA